MQSGFNKLGRAIGKFFKEILYFLASGTFWKTLLLIGATLLLIGFLTLQGLNCYTRHGTSLTVDNYVGMDIRDAMERIDEKNFELMIIDSLFLTSKRPGTILEQSPKKGSSVKKGRKIYVRIAKREPEPRQMPGLAQGNDDMQRYRKKLERIDVHMKVKGREFNKILEEGTIMRVYHNGKNITEKVYSKQGYKVQQTDTVEVIVSTRSAGKVPLVNLVCRTLDECRFLLQSHELEMGQVIEDADVFDANTAYVYRQFPAYDTTATIDVGGRVDLYIRQAKPGNCLSQ